LHEIVADVRVPQVPGAGGQDHFSR
jgi:hypothetical protein